jgi:hypothetical protein
MTHYEAMGLDSTLKNAIKNDDLDTIESILTSTPTAEKQNDLNASLVMAMPQGSLATIELLLSLGAKLKQASWISVWRRKSTKIFQLLIDAG